METAVRLIAGIALLTAAVAYAAPAGKGPPSEFPGNGNGPPHGWFPGKGNGLDKGAGDSGPVGNGGSSGSDSGSGYPSSTPDVHTVPEPSTLVLSIAALGILARVTSRRR